MLESQIPLEVQLLDLQTAGNFQIFKYLTVRIYLNCGPEIGVASTKAYTSQIVAITLFALILGEDSIETADRRKQIIEALHELPTLVGNAIDYFDSSMKAVSESVKDAKSLLVLGRGFQYATCLEAALVRFNTSSKNNLL